MSWKTTTIHLMKGAYIAVYRDSALFLGKIVFYDCDNYKKPLSPNQVIYLKRRFFYA